MEYGARSGEVLAEAHLVNTANTRPQGESKRGRKSDAKFQKPNLRIIAARSPLQVHGIELLVCQIDYGLRARIILV